MEEELKEIREIALENKKAIQENKDNIKENAYGIEILRDYKKSNQRLYILVILLIIAIIILGLHHLIWTSFYSLKMIMTT